MLSTVAAPTSAPAFAHLHVHSQFSFLDGMVNEDNVFEWIAGHRQNTIAFTDHGTLAGIWRFRRAVEKFNKDRDPSQHARFIPALETYVAIDSARERSFVEIFADTDTGDVDDDIARDEYDESDPTGEAEYERLAAMAAASGRELTPAEKPNLGLPPLPKMKKRYYEHLTLLAATPEGWRNLVRIQNLADRPAHRYGRGILTDVETLAKHSEGIICLTGCLGGMVMGPYSQHVATSLDAANAKAALATVGIDAEDFRPVFVTLTEELAQARQKFEHELATLTAEKESLQSEPGYSKAEVTAINKQIKTLEPERDKAIDSARARARSTIGQHFAQVERQLSSADRAVQTLERAEGNLTKLRDIYGADRLFVEIMEHGIEAETQSLPGLVALARRFGLRCVATNDAHYTKPEDAVAHEAWLAKQSKKRLDDPKRYHFHGEGYHLASEAEMRAKRPEQWWQDAVSLAGHVAAMCEPDVLPPRKDRFPAFEAPEEFASNEDYLVSLAIQGAREFYGDPTPQDVVDRLNLEFKVMRDSGTLDYFLVVRDLLKWVDTQGVSRGWGRGSAAGSVLGFCLDIHRIDPIRHGLLFERFLEPGRVGWPDVDSDVRSSWQHKCFSYLTERWGADRSARIANFGFARTRLAIKHAGFVLDLDMAGARLSKAVPVLGGKPASMKYLFDLENRDAEEFRRLVEELNEPDRSGRANRARDIIELATKFEDLADKNGVHACGFVISSEPLHDLIPLRTVLNDDGNPEVITAWDGADVEDFGLVKLDVLGIKNIDIADIALDFVREQDPEFSTRLASVPDPDDLDDPMVVKAWELLRAGLNSGVFQMEGAGITDTGKLIQPQSWADLSAILAVFRPGPMAAGYHEEYGLRRNGINKVSYDEITRDPREQEVLASVLDETYGLMIFQEQIMTLSRVMCGFEARRRSVLRKAVGKKKKDVMAGIKAEFVEGATSAAVDDLGNTTLVFSAETAERVWGLIEANAEYLFNKSHSVAYSMLTFATAYIKANWPASFVSGQLAITDDANKLVRVMQSAQQEGVEILSPDVNRSRAVAHPIDDRTVVLGLGDIKGINEATAEHILENREAVGGSFGSFQEFVLAKPSRDDKPLTPLAVEMLIESGACDQWGTRLGLVMANRLQSPGMPTPIPEFEWGALQRANRQRRRIRMAMGESVLSIFETQIKESVVGTGVLNDSMAYKSLIEVEQITSQPTGSVGVKCVIGSWKTKPHKGGLKAEVSLMGQTGSFSGVMWADAVEMQQRSGLPEVGDIAIVYGRISERTQVSEDPETGEETRVTTTSFSIRTIVPVPINDPIVTPEILWGTVPEFQRPRFPSAEQFSDMLKERNKAAVAELGKGPTPEQRAQARDSVAVIIPRASASTGAVSVSSVTAASIQKMIGYQFFDEAPQPVLLDLPEDAATPVITTVPPAAAPVSVVSPPAAPANLAHPQLPARQQSTVDAIAELFDMEIDTGPSAEPEPEEPAPAAVPTPSQNAWPMQMPLTEAERTQTQDAGPEMTSWPVQEEQAVEQAAASPWPVQGFVTAEPEEPAPAATPAPLPNGTVLLGAVRVRRGVRQNPQLRALLAQTFPPNKINDIMSTLLQKVKAADDFLERPSIVIEFYEAEAPYAVEFSPE